MDAKPAGVCFWLNSWTKKSDGGSDNKDCNFVQFVFDSIFTTAAGSLRTNLKAPMYAVFSQAKDNWPNHKPAAEATSGGSVGIRVKEQWSCIWATENYHDSTLSFQD